MNPEEKPFAYIVLSERGSHVATFLTEKEKEQFLKTSLFREHDKIIELFQKPISPGKCETEMVYDDSKIYYNFSVAAELDTPFNIEPNLNNDLYENNTFKSEAIRMVFDILKRVGGKEQCSLQDELLDRLAQYVKEIQKSYSAYKNDFVFVIGFNDEILDNLFAKKLRNAKIDFVKLKTFETVEFFS